MNFTDRKRIKNTGNSLVSTHGFTFLPGQIITVLDKIWNNKEMYKVSGLEAEPKNGNALSEEKDKMLNYAITRYLAEVTAGTVPTEKVVSGITYQGYIIKSGDIPLIFFKEKAITPVPVESVSINEQSPTLTSVGATADLTCTISPNTATDKSVTWYSTNEAVATVEETTTGATVTAVATGSCRVYVQTESENKKSYVTVTVNIPVVEGGG